jgi:hypothetical protein
VLTCFVLPTSYATFRSITATTDPDAPADHAQAGHTSRFGPDSLTTSTTRATARRLRRTRQRLGAYRHDLLVAMRVVNGVEAQVIRSEWETWLADEVGRCERVGELLQKAEAEVEDQTGKEGKTERKRREKDGGLPFDEEQMKVLMTWYHEYCGSCEREAKVLFPGRERML